MDTRPSTAYRQCSPTARLLGRGFLRLFGWQYRGEVPNAKNMVVIAAPHTSNWDLVFLVAAAFAFGFSINWLGKDSLFKKPILGTLLLWLGGVAVDRSRSNNMVDSLTLRIRTSDGTNLVVPPSGTRSYTDYWKSGFYHIARNAEIPLVCGYLDYAKKEAGLGPSFTPGNLAADMDRLRAFYEPITARYPDRKSRIRLREEDTPDRATG